MKIRDAMTPDPICCLPTETIRKVATLMRDRNVGAIPVVASQQTRKLVGIVTDRDLCCAALALGADPTTTEISKFVIVNPVTCREGESVQHCEQAMSSKQVRRIPIVDGDGRCIGIISQADLALKDRQTERFAKTVAGISEPRSEHRSPVA